MVLGGILKILDDICGNVDVFFVSCFSFAGFCCFWAGCLRFRAGFLRRWWCWV